MRNINRLPEEDIFELMHNRYLEEMKECNYPMHVMDMYGYGPLCFLNNLEEQEPPQIEHPCHMCGKEIEPSAIGHTSYCSLECSQHDQL